MCTSAWLNNSILLTSTGEPSWENDILHFSNYLRHITNFCIATSPYFGSLFIHLVWLESTSGTSCMKILFQRYLTRGSEKKSYLFFAQFSLNVLKSISLTLMHSVGRIFLIEQGKSIVKSLSVFSSSMRSCGSLRSFMKICTFLK